MRRRTEALPGHAFTSWLGLFAPAGTPAPARDRLEQLGYEPVGSTPEEFAALFAAELPRVAELVRISGATLD